jgi:hypothetical protein
MAVMPQMLWGQNLAFITTRQTRDEWDALGTSHICGHKSCAAYDINSLFPLYLYPPSDDQTHQKTLLEPAAGRRANFSEGFIAEVEARLGLRFEAPTPTSLRSVAPPPTSGEGKASYPFPLP